MAEIFGMDGVVVVPFGGSRITKLARSLGLARREFHAGLTEGGEYFAGTRSEPHPVVGTD
ncbi:MAG TPA: hypothetical protein VMF60_06600 [Acidimicrobiales bacterium]|nr:hypothetical protein [Acidimicrobiales bacterium]